MKKITEEETEKIISEIVELQLPEFAKCAKSTSTDTIMLTQEAFLSTEFNLLGAAIKYAGYNKKTVHIIPHG